MKFHLDFIPKPSPFKIDHQSKVLLCGSCFSDNIGNILEAHQFQTSINPLGIFFNPSSLADSLASVINQTPVDERFIVKRDDIYVSYLHHSRLWAGDPHHLTDLIHNKRKEFFAFLK